MPSSNILLFDANKANMMSDEQYNTNTQRLNGVQSGIASSQLQNKTLYQVSLVAYAIAQIMNQNGFDANDTAAVSAFVANLSGTMLQKVADLASTQEAQAGADDTKYMTALKTSQTIGAKVASKPEAEAGTDNSKLMTPLRTKQFVINDLPNEHRAGHVLFRPSLMTPAVAGPYLPCTGGLYSRITYPDLYSAIGLNYGFAPKVQSNAAISSAIGSQRHLVTLDAFSGKYYALDAVYSSNTITFTVFRYNQNGTLIGSYNLYSGSQTAGRNYTMFIRADHNVVVAVISYYPNRNNSRIFISTDAGVTWTASDTTTANFYAVTATSTHVYLKDSQDVVWTFLKSTKTFSTATETLRWLGGTFGLNSSGYVLTENAVYTWPSKSQVATIPVEGYLSYATSAHLLNSKLYFSKSNKLLIMSTSNYSFVTLDIPDVGDSNYTDVVGVVQYDPTHVLVAVVLQDIYGSSTKYRFGMIDTSNKVNWTDFVDYTYHGALVKKSDNTILDTFYSTDNTKEGIRTLSTSDINFGTPAINIDNIAAYIRYQNKT